jgi:hypothetical protein
MNGADDLGSNSFTDTIPGDSIAFLLSLAGRCGGVEDDSLAAADLSRLGVDGFSPRLVPTLTVHEEVTFDSSWCSSRGARSTEALLAREPGSF